jgi:NAD+ kinase
VLAVNSSPSTSFGHFTCCTADTLDDVLERLQDDALAPTPLSRIRLLVDGVDHGQPVLNDVLVADTVPSATSRYVLGVGGQEEDQKSSGVWICTAAGSTGAMRSAGGQAMDMHDPRLQYVVREPCHQPGRDWHLLHGIVDGPVRLTSRMLAGGAFLDGRRVAVPLGFGVPVEIRPDGPPLRIVLMGGRTRAHHGL